MNSDAVQAFRDWARETCGVLVPADLPIGKIVQCSVDGKPASNKAGRAKLHLDGIAAGWAQNWTDGCGVHTWCSKTETEHTPAERAAYRTQVQAMQRERDAADAKITQAAVALSNRIWPDCAECSTDSYLTAKCVQPHGVRVTTHPLELPCTDGERVLPIPAGALVVPLRDCAGNLQTLQFIYVDGNETKKRFLPGGAKPAHYHVIGKPGPVVCIAEGYATAASIHEATGCAVVVAFDSGNLMSVALAIRAKHPDARILICADDDYHRPDNPGLTKATAAAKAVDGLVVKPDFGNDRPDRATDFNDLGKAQGIEAVKVQITKALAADVPLLAADDVLAVYELPTVAAIPTGVPSLDRTLDGGYRGVTLLCAPTGAGKSGFAIQCAATVARERSVVYFSTELPKRQVYARFGAQALRRGWRQLCDGGAATGLALSNVLRPLHLRVCEIRTVEQLGEALRSITRHEGAPPFAVVDYLQSFGRSELDTDRRATISRASSLITEWALATNGAALVVSSVSRAMYQTDDKLAPDEFLASAKESGDLEYDAATVMFLAVPRPPLGGRSAGRLVVAKARFGACAVLGLTFDGPTGIFVEDSEGALTKDQRVILKAISAGYYTGNAIAKEAGLQRAKVGPCLKALCAMGLIDSDNQLASEARQNGQNDATLPGNTLEPFPDSETPHPSPSGKVFPDDRKRQVLSDGVSPPLRGKPGNTCSEESGQTALHLVPAARGEDEF